MADEDGNKYLPDDEDVYYKSDTTAVDEVRLLTKDSGGLKAKLSTRFRGTRIVFQVTGSGICLVGERWLRRLRLHVCHREWGTGELIVRHDYDDFEEHEIIIACQLCDPHHILEYLCEGYNKDEKPTARRMTTTPPSTMHLIKNVRFTLPN